MLFKSRAKIAKYKEYHYQNYKNILDDYYNFLIHCCQCILANILTKKNNTNTNTKPPEINNSLNSNLVLATL